MQNVVNCLQLLSNKNYEVLTDTAAVPRCYPLFVRHARASPTMFVLNLIFLLYELFKKHLESFQHNNLLFLLPVSYYLPGKASLKLC